MSRAAPLVIDELNLCDEMTARLARCARLARTQVGGEVVQEAVVHAAVAGWFENAECQLDATIWAIHAAIRSATPLYPHVQHWPEEMAIRLDTLARKAGRALHCEVSRSAVVRAALTSWLGDAERRPTQLLAQAIHASKVTLTQPEAKPRGCRAPLPGRRCGPCRH